MGTKLKLNMRQIIRFVGSLWMFSTLQFALAYQVAKISLEELVKRSSDIAHVEIRAANEVTIQNGEGAISCGYDYEARVIERFKGLDEPTIKFRSVDWLTMGAEYVVFASTENFGSKLRFLSMGRDDHDIYERCAQGGSGLYVSEWHGEAFQFDYVGESLDQQRWLKSQADHLQVGPGVARREVDFSVISIPDEYADFYSFTAYRWTDIRRVLTATDE